MQNTFNRAFPGLLLLIVTLILVLGLFNIFEVSFFRMGSYFFVIYGFFTVYYNLGKRQKGMLFLGTVSFLCGILLLITLYYNFPSINELIIPSILFIAGGGFLFQFIDEPRNTVFLYSSIVLFFSSIIYIWLFKNFNFLIFTKDITELMIRYYPLLIILIGINLLISNKKR